jgi:uncharacterized membrane protein YqhA
MVGLFLPLRYLLLVASLGALIGAVLMFALGGAELFEASHALLDPGATVRGMTASILGATDAFLFGIVLVIFAYAVAFGFVFDLPPATRERLPAWMRVEGVGELKHTLVEVILVYLVVDFATDIAEEESPLPWEALVMPISIFLIAAAQRFLSSGRPGDHQAGFASRG